MVVSIVDHQHTYVSSRVLHRFCSFGRPFLAMVRDFVHLSTCILYRRRGMTWSLLCSITAGDVHLPCTHRESASDSGGVVFFSYAHWAHDHFRHASNDPARSALKLERARRYLISRVLCSKF